MNREKHRAIKVSGVIAPSPKFTTLGGFFLTLLFALPFALVVTVVRDT